MAIAKKSTRGNATTEVVLGQSAQHLTKAVAEILSAVGKVEELKTLGEELTLLVSNKEDAIKDLDVEFAEKERKLKVDLDLSFKANTDRVVTEYLRSIDKEAISSKELAGLKDTLAKTIAGTEAQIVKEVKAFQETSKLKFDNDTALLQAEHKVINAENKAKISSLETIVKALEAQITDYKEQLNAERVAGTARAQAGSIGTINLGDRGGK